MRFSVLLLLSLTLSVFGASCAAGADAALAAPPSRPAGSPGTPTPQPFVRPQPLASPAAAPHRLPLLDDGSGGSGGRLSPAHPGNLAPADDELPLLEQQRRRNSQGLLGNSPDND